MNLYARLTVRESSSSQCIVGRWSCRFPQPALRETPGRYDHRRVDEEQSRPRVRRLYATRQKFSDLLHAVTGARQEPRVVDSLQHRLAGVERPGAEPLTLGHSAVCL